LRPSESKKVDYPTLKLDKYLTYADLIDRVPSSHRVKNVEKAMSMEQLPINNGNGQSYGYIVYRKVLGELKNGDVFKGSWPRDFATILVDGDLIDTGFKAEKPEYWINSVKEVPLTNLKFDGNHTLDFMIGNLGRVNYGGRKDLVQQKGLPSVHQSKMELNGEELRDNMEIIALEFTNAWVKNLEGWRDIIKEEAPKAPCLFQSTFTISNEEDPPADTFLNMAAGGWHKGIVFVNGFHIGRYWKVGPQQHLYVPGPFLRTGQNNTITIFEELQVPTELDIVFSATPNLGRRENLIKAGP